MAIYTVCFTPLQKGRTDPRTLSRAARDLLPTDAVFCLRVGRLAIDRILYGFGYDLTGADIIEACDRFMAAAEKLGVASDAKDDMARLAEKCPSQDAMFCDALLRHLMRSTEPTSRRS